MSRERLPLVVAGGLALIYVLVSPPSLDLAAHLERAQQFGAAPFSIWDNWWYGGHHTPGYSLLFPAVAWLLTPQLAAGLAATGTAAAFAALARRHAGERAVLAGAWFALAAGANLFTGRLAFAFGLLPATAAVLALAGRRTVIACALAALSALCSPVAAVFAALAAVSAALAARRPRLRAAGLALATSALVPVALLTVAFPEGGTEPYSLSAMLPVALLAAAAVALLPREERVLRAGAALYGTGVVAAFAIPNAAGSNVGRLGPLLAGPLAALVWWPGRARRLALLAPALLYLQLQAPVSDVVAASGDPSTSAAYYAPLLRFLATRRGEGPFRVEIPFTGLHWEAYRVAPSFPLARGWERQLDRRDDGLFYDDSGRVGAATYRAWLDSLAVRFVAVPDVPLDSSATGEAALIARGLPYLRAVFSSRHWRVYEVAGAPPLVSGAARATAIEPDAIVLRAARPGSAEVRVRWTPYWRLPAGVGCVTRAGDFTRLELRRAGPVRLAASFSLGRVAADTRRCT